MQQSAKSKLGLIKWILERHPERRSRIFSADRGGSMSNVLVIFQADTEATEQLALAVGVGAVEAEGSIRLRRLAAADAVEVGHRSYGKLQAPDLLWANTIVVGLE
jgi:hypothetical protein